MRGTGVQRLNSLINPWEWCFIFLKRFKEGWAVLPKRWVVERTFAWLNNCRRPAKDFEILTATAENLIRIAMLKITLAKCIRSFVRQLLSALRYTPQGPAAGWPLSRIPNVTGTEVQYETGIGIPSILTLPLAFGIGTRRSGCAR